MTMNSSTSSSIPSEIVEILNKLEDTADQEKVKSYIESLQAEVSALKGEPTSHSPEAMETEAEEPQEDSGSNAREATEAAEEEEHTTMPPLYEAGEDYDKQASHKEKAEDYKAANDWSSALSEYSAAVLSAPPSALLYANRAMVLVKLGQYKAAERDCNEALKLNPDSAKALRIRGKTRKELGQWEEALADLSASQTIDFDEGTVEDLKFLTEKHLEMERAEAEKRIEQEEKLRKRAEEIKKAQEEAKKEKATADSDGGSSPRGMPGAGMPGMPGMSEMMSALMSDPELLAAMQNPKVQAAFQELMSGPGGPMGLMSNPAKIQELMQDPEVGPVLQKLLAKLGPAMGMPAGAAAGGDDDIPDIDAMGGDIDLDDIPDMSS